ncbi:MAG: hypothetical protein J6T54_12400 [Fibrobacter sp.]|nr:hypothetical protein [Fibrobacter sp.]
MPLEEAVAGGIKGLADIGFGIYDRYKQKEKDKERKETVEKAVAQTSSDYDKMIKLLEDYRAGQTSLSSPKLLARYRQLLEGYNPEDYTYDFEKFAFVDESGKPITREDYIAQNREQILQDVSDRLQHTASGAGLGRGTGAGLNIAKGVTEKDEELLKMASEQFGQDRSQAYTEWSDYINKMQSKLDRKREGELGFAEMAKGAISSDEQKQSDYMADLLALMQGKSSSVNQANLALLT